MNFQDNLIIKTFLSLNKNFQRIPILRNILFYSTWDSSCEREVSWDTSVVGTNRTLFG